MKSSSAIPKITIGMPVYNGQSYLKYALDSILSQTFENFELIVSDNASSDGTSKILAEYADRDDRIQVIKQPVNLGAAANYNILVDLAQGEYFKWAAHDDELEKTFLEKCYFAIEQAPGSPALAFPRTHWIRADGSSIGNYTDNMPWTPGGRPNERLRDLLADPKYSYLLKCSPIFGLIRLDALRRTRRIQSFMSSDRVTLVELALLGDWIEVPDYLFRRRLHEQTSLAKSKDEAEVLQWFDPKSKSSYHMLRVTLFRGYLRAVCTMPVSLIERLKCLRVLVGLFYREWRILGGELKIKILRFLNLGRSKKIDSKRSWAENASDVENDQS